MKTLALDWLASGATASAIGMLLAGTNFRGVATGASSAWSIHQDEASKPSAAWIEFYVAEHSTSGSCTTAKPTTSCPEWVKTRLRLKHPYVSFHQQRMYPRSRSR